MENMDRDDEEVVRQIELFAGVVAKAIVSAAMVTTSAQLLNQALTDMKFNEIVTQEKASNE